MNTKTLSQRALSVIDQYLHFTVNGASCSVPYFNNKTTGARAALAVSVGKGSPREIFDEVQAMAVKSHTSLDGLSGETLKKMLTDANIGIDCSGFSYFVLNAESQERGAGTLDRHLKFIRAGGFLGRFISSINPVKNTDVATFADDRNSVPIMLKDLQPGDFISFTGGAEGADRNHILIIHQIDYQNFVPMIIYYSHAVAYPEDGVYGTGIRQGSIEIVDPSKPLTEGRWTEDGKTGTDNRIYNRALKSKTETRRLKWF